MPPQDLWLPPHTCLSRPGPGPPDKPQYLLSIALISGFKRKKFFLSVDLYNQYFATLAGATDRHGSLSVLFFHTNRKILL